MPYEIIIKETGSRVKKETGQWAKIDTTFFTQQDFDKLTWMDRDKLNLSDTEKLTKSVMGYTPDREVEKTFETEIFKQVVETLDLPAVVKAINKL